MIRLGPGRAVLLGSFLLSIYMAALEPTYGELVESTLSKIPEPRKPPRCCSLTLAAKQNTLYDF